MKFRPLHDRIVVKRIEAEEKTAGGIIIPDTVKEKPSQGEVVAVGPGGRDEAGKLIPIDIRAGDRVLFGKWSGTEVKIDGEDLLIMKESDIFGVIEEGVAKKRPPERNPSSRPRRSARRGAGTDEVTTSSAHPRGADQRPAFYCASNDRPAGMRSPTE